MLFWEGRYTESPRVGIGSAGPGGRARSDIGITARKNAEVGESASNQFIVGSFT